MKDFVSNTHWIIPVLAILNILTAEHSSVTPWIVIGLYFFILFTIKWSNRAVVENIISNHNKNKLHIKWKKFSDGEFCIYVEKELIDEYILKQLPSRKYEIKNINDIKFVLYDELINDEATNKMIEEIAASIKKKDVIKDIK